MLTAIGGRNPGLCHESNGDGAASPLMDVFSAGIVLTECSLARALIAGKNPLPSSSKSSTSNHPAQGLAPRPTPYGLSCFAPFNSTRARAKAGVQR
jgi:hypothetical protein